MALDIARSSHAYESKLQTVLADSEMQLASIMDKEASLQRQLTIAKEQTVNMLAEWDEEQDEEIVKLRVAHDRKEEQMTRKSTEMESELTTVRGLYANAQRKLTHMKKRSETKSAELYEAHKKKKELTLALSRLDHMVQLRGDDVRKQKTLITELRVDVESKNSDIMALREQAMYLLEQRKHNDVQAAKEQFDAALKSLEDEQFAKHQEVVELKSLVKNDDKRMQAAQDSIRSLEQHVADQRTAMSRIRADIASSRTLHELRGKHSVKKDTAGYVNFLQQETEVQRQLRSMRLVSDRNATQFANAKQELFVQEELKVIRTSGLVEEINALRYDNMDQANEIKALKSALYAVKMQQRATGAASSRTNTGMRRERILGAATAKSSVSDASTSWQTSTPDTTKKQQQLQQVSGSQYQLATPQSLKDWALQGSRVPDASATAFAAPSSSSKAMQFQQVFAQMDADRPYAGAEQETKSFIREARQFTKKVTQPSIASMRGRQIAASTLRGSKPQRPQTARFARRKPSKKAMASREERMKGVGKPRFA